MHEIIVAMERVFGPKVPVNVSLRRAGDPPMSYVDPTEVERVLGFRRWFDNISERVGTAMRFHVKAQGAAGVKS